MKRSSTLRFYILTSNDQPALARFFDPKYSNLDPKDAVVVINTLDDYHKRLAKSFCEKNNIEYHVTESDGTPSTGKNSLLNIFLESEDNYCCLVDGDDLLTPHGVWFYKNLESLEKVPDALFLLNQKSVKLKPENTLLSQPFTVNYDKLLDFDYTKFFTEEHGLDEDIAKFYNDLHKEYYNKSKKYSEGAEAHSRVTWFSRKAAEFKFPNSVAVGEDTLQMYTLKDQAVLGNLDVRTTDENPATYLYDQTNPGMVAMVSEGYSNYDWMQFYLIQLKQMEDDNKLHKGVTLPKLIMEYPEDYSLGDYGITR